MDQLLAMRVFVRISDAGSFAKAADSLNLPRSSVSKLLQDLEQHLRTKLVERNTRGLTITPEGEAYRGEPKRLLSELDDLDAAAAGTQMRPRGRLRVDIGSSLANLVIIPRLPEFRAHYPDVDLLLGVNDRPVDMVGDGVDCVIRGGELPDSTLIAKAALHAKVGDLRNARLSGRERDADPSSGARRGSYSRHLPVSADRKVASHALCEGRGSLRH